MPKRVASKVLPKDTFARSKFYAIVAENPEEKSRTKLVYSLFIPSPDVMPGGEDMNGLLVTYVDGSGITSTQGVLSSLVDVSQILVICRVSTMFNFSIELADLKKEIELISSKKKSGFMKGADAGKAWLQYVLENVDKDIDHRDLYFPSRKITKKLVDWIESLAKQEQRDPNDEGMAKIVKYEDLPKESSKASMGNW